MVFTQLRIFVVKTAQNNVPWTKNVNSLIVIKEMFTKFTKLENKDFFS